MREQTHAAESGLKGNRDKYEAMIKREKSKKFAVRIIKFYQYLQDEKHEYVLSKQLLRSGTAIGANIAESVNAQSKKDFLSKINIALKEATETKYWLEILYEAEIGNKEFESLTTDCTELEKILTSAVKTIKHES